MHNSYNSMVDTLGKLATLAVAETAVIGMYAGYALCKAINKHRVVKAEKIKPKYN